MPLSLTPESFTKLLGCLDEDRDRAGQKYEDLRRTLIRFFEWRGAPTPEDHADQTLDRFARKVAEGVEIRNVGAYCYEVARLVCLEALKGQDQRWIPLESTSALVSDSAGERDVEREVREACLESCLQQLPEASRELILAYYRDDKRTRIDGRRALAERFGLQRESLANRAQRIRDKLEQCVVACGRKSAI